MKVINLDEVEIECIKWGIKNGLFTEKDLKQDNLFSIKLLGKYHNKKCTLIFRGMSIETCKGKSNKIILVSKTWEDLYYKIKDFFND